MSFYYKILGYKIAFLCLLTACSLFIIKDNVMMIKYELKEVKKQINSEKDAIKIFKAEFAYLSSPERISVLASKYLVLETSKTAQITRDPLISVEQKKERIIADINSRKYNTKWRYKKGPAKYLNVSKK